MSGKISKKDIPNKIRKLKAEGKSQRQAVAIAINMADGYYVPWMGCWFDGGLQGSRTPLISCVTGRSPHQAAPQPINK